ncbi:MAG: hypothetical protein RLN81_03480 [Balneolaceae bacterium]
MKNIGSLLLILLFGVTPLLHGQEKPGLINSTDRYEFYSNFWINQHHFLYANADSAEEGNWDNGFSNGELTELSLSEIETLKEGIIFYRDSVISYDLLFNRGLSNLKRTLINFAEDEAFEMEDFSDELVSHLNKIKPIYRKYFWEQHNQLNKSILNQNLEFIKKHEDQIFERVSELAQQPWKEGKVRVDISYYASWAGAYTSTRPETHVVLTSQNDGPNGNWLELLFHEPCHSIMSGRNYKAAELISQISEKLELDPPRNLWHSLLFYFSGVTVQEALKKEDVEYELYMIRKEVFSNHHEVIFKHMPAYLSGELAFEEALENLIVDYND